MTDIITVQSDLATLSKKQKKFRNAFEFAKSVDESLKAFKKMEPLFNKSDLGLPYLTLAEKLLEQARPEETLVFAHKSLQILLANIHNNVSCFGKYSAGVIGNCSRIHNSSFFVAKVYNILGSAYGVLKRSDDELVYLNWTNRTLSTLENDEEEIGCNGKCVLNAIENNQLQLYRIKFSTNMWAEAALHRRKILEVKERVLEEGCIEIGEASFDVSNAYFRAMNVKEALPFALKALEIKTKCLGSDSLEVAEMRKSVGRIYQELGEKEKWLENEKLAESVLKEMDREYSPDEMLALGWYEELIDEIKGVLSRDDIPDTTRSAALVFMARAFFGLGKNREASKCMRKARKSFEKNGANQIYLASLIADLSTLYQKLNDSETALSLIRKVLAFPELSPNLLSRCVTIFFSLIPKRKFEAELPFMLDLVEKLKKVFGPEHCQVGYAYANLGKVYWKAGQWELAAKIVTNGKDILDATIGPQHVDSLKTCHLLSTFYAQLGRCVLALEIEEKVVKGLGPGEQELLDDAVFLVNELKLMIAASRSSSSQSQDDGEDLSSEMISKCGVTGDDDDDDKKI